MNKPKAVALQKLMPVKVPVKAVLILNPKRLPARPRAELSANWVTVLNTFKLADVRAKIMAHARTSTSIQTWDQRGKARAKAKGNERNPMDLPVAVLKKERARVNVDLLL